MAALLSRPVLRPGWRHSLGGGRAINNISASSAMQAFGTNAEKMETSRTRMDAVRQCFYNFRSGTGLPPSSPRIAPTPRHPTAPARPIPAGIAQRRGVYSGRFSTKSDCCSLTIALMCCPARQMPCANSRVTSTRSNQGVSRQSFQPSRKQYRCSNPSSTRTQRWTSGCWSSRTERTMPGRQQTTHSPLSTEFRQLSMR